MDSFALSFEDYIPLVSDPTSTSSPIFSPTPTSLSNPTSSLPSSSKPCAECGRRSDVVSLSPSLALCQECIGMVLLYYHKCNRCADGKVSPIGMASPPVCAECTAAAAGEPETFPCQTSGCTGTVDAKWKTKCLSCFKASPGSRTYQSGYAARPASTASEKFPCQTPGCGRDTGAQWKSKCLTCFRRKA